ncbi:MAG: hypothetical protein ACK41P_06220 [Asticcacaulis sp.]
MSVGQAIVKWLVMLAGLMALLSGAHASERDLALHASSHTAPHSAPHSGPHAAHQHLMGSASTPCCPDKGGNHHNAASAHCGHITAAPTPDAAMAVTDAARSRLEVRALAALSGRGSAPLVPPPRRL